MPPFGAGIERIARYNRLIWGDMYELQYHGRQGTVRIAPAGTVRPYSQGRIDMELAGLLTFGRRFTGKPIAAQQLTLRQPMPSYHRQYDVFGCPVTFSQPDDSISKRRNAPINASAAPATTRRESASPPPP